MAQQTDDGYFHRIEEHFGRRRGGPLVLSPRDWQLVQGWQQRGIPLPVVLRGINRAFDRFGAGGPRADRINSLRYCAQEIEAVWEEHRVGGAATAEGRPPSRPGLPHAAHHLRTLAASCRERTAGELETRLGGHLEDAAGALDSLAAAAEAGNIAARELDNRASEVQRRLEDRLGREDAGVSLAQLGLPAFSPYEV